MHFILGLLGAIVTIAILLKRLDDAGISLGGLNPFLWKRRRDWRKQYDGNPVFKVSSPMDATAILMVAAAKADGDMSAESKQRILELFQSEFKLSEKDASGLMASSTHLLGDGIDVREKLDGFLKPSKSSFTESQAKSALSMIEKAARSSDSSIHPSAQEFITKVEKELIVEPANESGWQ